MHVVSLIGLPYLPRLKSESGAFLIQNTSAQPTTQPTTHQVAKQRDALSPLDATTLKYRRPHRGRIRFRPRWRRLAPIVTLALVILTWQLIYAAQLYPTFLVPAPISVLETFYAKLVDGTLPHHFGVTLTETALGLFIGVMVGSILGYVIANVPILEDVLSPVIVAFQSTPTIAYAPLLILWFGNGIQSKVIIVVIIVFFPTMMNTIVGLRAVPRGLRDVVCSLNASRWQMFTKLELPAGLAVLLTGLKTSATLAVIGAVVGEFVSVSDGLGSMVAIARNQFNTPLVYAGVITLSLMALALYSLVSLLEKRFLRWRRYSRV